MQFDLTNNSCISVEYLQAACWSPDGLNLLFATVEEPTIYCLTFQKAQPGVTGPVIGGSKVAVCSADVSQVDIETEDSKMRYKSSGSHTLFCVLVCKSLKSLKEVKRYPELTT